MFLKIIIMLYVKLFRVINMFHNRPIIILVDFAINVSGESSINENQNAQSLLKCEVQYSHVNIAKL